jgi:hypothetical protein
VATGRVPNTDDLGLDSVGLKPNMRGYIATNERLETDVPGIWALGDINQRGAFTHTSYHDHEILAENLAGGQRSADDRTAIYAMFTDPAGPRGPVRGRGTAPGGAGPAHLTGGACHGARESGQGRAKPSAPSSC